MSERGARRGAGAPFYAPLRRKTSAEIISEARAAIYGEMSGASNSGGGGAGGALRALRTRRPYTPREPQRALYTERTRIKETRPPSAFDLKFLSLSESGEESLAALDARLANLEEDALDDMLNDTHTNKKKPQQLRAARPAPASQNMAGDSWGGFTKLPHLSGRSKPLHRRNTTGQVQTDDIKTEIALAQAISVTRPLAEYDAYMDNNNSKSSSAESSAKRSQFAVSKSVSYEVPAGNPNNEIAVKHLAVQLPNTSPDQYDKMSTLELAEALSQKSRSTSRTLQLLEAVRRNAEVQPPGGALRELLLRALYTHIEHPDDEVLVALARALLTLRVTGPHLTTACKLVFKIAKNDKNDHYFRNTNLLELVVEGCGRAEPVSESACCVFGCAALRVLALEPRLAARATAAGAVHLTALHLKILNNAKAENPRSLDEQCTHALYQVTGALRSLASVVDAHAHEFVASGALPELVAALSLHTDRDVLTNVARCLSVLSVSSACLSSLVVAAGAARALLRALAACGARAALAVRLAYTLGNMAAAAERARDDIYNEEGSIDVLLTILESYTQRIAQGARDADQDPDLHLIGTDLGGSDGSDEDVLIKTVRVVANLCLSERAGRGLAATHAERTVKALYACLQLADNIVEHESMSSEERLSTMERREELATAALATLNNLTFYREPPDPPDPLHLHYDNICKMTCGWVRVGDSAASCEAVRALGNMSRAPRTAQLIVLHGALDTLEPFLLHESCAVRCAAAGVLVNVCGAGAAHSSAAALAARALVWSAARGDAAAAPLLARALWNAHAHAPRPLDPRHAHDVAAALTVFIDDESVFAACEASRLGDRHDTESPIARHHVTFEMDDEKAGDCEGVCYDGMKGARGEWEEGAEGLEGDLGFEEGEAEECACAACRRLAHWDELVAVAIPLMERMRPARHDAAVGTD
ncbi:uncharacterized protein LOC142981605 [Anticarsia gemmatalis]|uniref:uncharacterized protein LOC142981605 n=1 Tax=Anticarsia gemmatalis TaxID=129554 RepID=UPI003F76D145